jgi:hypothetical protein
MMIMMMMMMMMTTIIIQFTSIQFIYFIQVLAISEWPVTGEH